MALRLPLASLSVRKGNGPEGEDLAPEVRVEWPTGAPTVAAVGPMVILVHGYNNCHAEARYKYAVFRALLGSGLPVLEFHWPGNKSWGWLGFAAYPAVVGNAVASGQRLADWMAHVAPLAQFYLVTHSLGGRVAVEAIQRLRASQSADRLLGVCMMAAAVRVDQVAEGRLGPRPGERARWEVLFSRRDTVLQWAFPIGQTAAGDGFFPTAVGRDGEPRDHWRAVEAPGYQHKNYWFGGPADEIDADSTSVPVAGPVPSRDPTRPGDRESSTAVLEFLGGSPPHLVIRDPGPAIHEQPEHRLPESNIFIHRLEGH